MLDVVQAVLVCCAVLSLPATVGVFGVKARERVHGRSASFARVTALATAGGLVAVLVAAALGRPPAVAAFAAAVVLLSCLAWAPMSRSWAARGVVAWAITLDTGLLFLVYVLLWTVSSDLTPLGATLGLLLWGLEAFVFLIGVGYVWEFVDVLARRTWHRETDPLDLTAEQRTHRPFVSLHVPTHNEPPGLVIATLERLLALDYDDFEILLVDNNTTDPAIWQPVEAFCAQHPRITFLHLEDWPGFKSGALNHALTVTDPRAEVIGIVDADYLVDSDFLRECAPLFADPSVAFVQTPQDYRDWEQAPYFRRLYRSYGYFFDVSQRSRNERNAAIFGGTMGLIRRDALAAAGGWDEWCITEDAELSLRLLKAGGQGLHVHRSYGRGVMPLTFEALKRQRYRWCFGGVQILRMHWRSLLPGRRSEANQLSPAQRWGYLVGGLQWFGDLAGILFTAFVLAGALDLVVGGGMVLRRFSGFLVLCIAVLLVLGILRSLALLRRTSGASWPEAIGAFGLWCALCLSVARACAQGLVAKEGKFLRTPKVRGELRARHALLGNIPESLLALTCATAAVLCLGRPSPAGAVLGGLLLLQAASFASAPLNSLAAIRADLPRDLQQRRRVALVSWSGPTRRGGWAIGLLGTAAVVTVMAAAPVGSPPLFAPAIPATEQDTEQRGPATPRNPPVGAGSESTDSDGDTASDPATPGGASTTPSVSSTHRPGASSPSEGASLSTDSPPAVPTSTPVGRPSPTTVPSTTAPTPTSRPQPTTRPTPNPSGKAPTGRPSDLATGRP